MFFSSNKKLGIVGGGQLGKMLLFETHKWDITTHVLDPSPESPCKHLCHHFKQGDLMDYDTLYQFGKRVDTLTVEIEHINTDALTQLEKEGVNVYPQPHVLSIIKNKVVQKLFYQSEHIPTANFSVFNSKKDLVGKQAAYPYIWKSALFGYDGKGVVVVRNHEIESQLPEGACIVENIVPIKKELSVIVARNTKGDIVSYPVVEMDFHLEANLVEYVISPAKVSKEIAQKTTEIAIRVAKKMAHVGLLAVELFLTENDDILVNEVAPRPHNSGHFSIEGSVTNQFEQHIRAVLGLPLGSADIKIPSVMINLVGAEGFTGRVHYKGMEKALSMKGVTPHIYGKKETRPFRKMGHITIVNSDLENAIKIANTVKNTVQVIAL